MGSKVVRYVLKSRLCSIKQVATFVFGYLQPRLYICKDASLRLCSYYTTNIFLGPEHTFDPAPGSYLRHYTYHIHFD
jgi:hypothetical protein